MMNLPRAAFVTTIAAVTLGACGGQVAVDCKNGGCNEGGGGATTIVVSSSGTGTDPGCPEAVPQDGNACAFADKYCSYGEVCDQQWEARCDPQTMTWVVDEYWESCNPPFPDCPAEEPNNGESCDTDTSFEPCYYWNEWCNFQMTAECLGGQWQIDNIECNPPPPTLCYAAADEQACQGLAPSCTWYEPGCGDDPLDYAGCHPSFDCSTDNDCEDEATCESVSINPCHNLPCDQCGEQHDLCVAPGDGDEGGGDGDVPTP